MNWIHWALLSAIFAGATAVLAKSGVDGVNPHIATAVRTTVVLVVTWLIALVAAKPSEVWLLPKRAWIFLGISGIATGLSWLCYFRALQLGEVSKVAPVDKLGVVFAIVFAALFLRERLTLQHWTGCALIVAGALILAWKA